MSQNQIDTELKQVLANLYEQGFKLNETEAWILLECRNISYTINELTEKRRLSYEIMRRYVNKLASIKLLIPSAYAGKETLWKCPIDVTQIKDATFRVSVEGTKLNLEEFLGYLKINWPKNYNQMALYAMSHLVFRLQAIANGDRPADPSSTAMRELIETAHSEVLGFAAILQQLIDSPIWDDRPDTYKYLTAEFTHENTATLVKLNNHMLTQHFNNKVLSRKGYIDKPKPKEAAKVGLDMEQE